jgi:TonB family protein
MFDKSSSWNRFKGEESRGIGIHLGYVPELEEEDHEEKMRVRIAVGVAVLLHVILFIMTFPEMSGIALQAGPTRQVFVVKQVRFEPPPPQATQQKPRETKKVKKIPIPDPTPDEPEPIVLEEVDLPETDLTNLDDVIFGSNSIPSIPGGSGRWPMKIGSGVMPPKKIYAPQPLYTEEARQARIQGVVILEAVINEKGHVENVKILKGLPEGLSESAVKTAAEWEFEPATLKGEPVPVYFNLTIRFSLQ